MKGRVFCSLLGMRRRKEAFRLLSSTLSLVIFASAVMVSSMLPSVAISAEDMIPPSAPSNLTVVRSGGALKLSWSASTDTVGVVGYRVERSQYGDLAWLPEYSLYNRLGTTSALSFEDKTALPNTIYTYRVYAYDAANNSSYSSASGIIDTAPPSVPAKLAISRVESELKLTWKPSEDVLPGVGLAGYEIERAPGDSEVWSRIDTATPDATEYSDAAPANMLYRYRVRAYDGEGNASNYSNSVKGAVDTAAPSSPSHLVAFCNEASATVSLSWEQATDNPGIRAYDIERRTDLEEWKSFATVESTSYAYEVASVDQAKTWEYRVKAVDFGDNSSYSETASVYVPDLTPPDAPLWGDPDPENYEDTGLTRDQNNNFKLTWIAPDDNVGVVGYRLYKSDVILPPESDSWSTIATTTATSFTDMSPAPNTSWFYMVKAYDAAGNISASAYPIMGMIDTLAPAAPANLKVARTPQKKLNLTWSEAVDYPESGGRVAGYEVWRSADQQNWGTRPIADIDAFEAEIDDSGTVSYTDASSSLKADTRYYYKVRAYDDAHNGRFPSLTQSFSAVANGIVDTLRPSFSTTPKATPYSANAVALSFTATDTGSGIAGYKIERSADGKTNWSKVKDNLTSTSFIDEGRVPNTVYYYRVTAFDKQGNAMVSSVVNARTYQRISREENAPYFTWKGSWTTGKNSVYSGGSTKYTSTKDNAVSITFRGGSVYWMGAKTASRGKANVYIDGKLAETVDQYAKTTATNQVIFPKAGLSNAVHTLKIVALGGGITEVDRIMIDGTCPGVNFEQTAAKTGGSWTTKSSSSYSNGSAAASSSTNAYSEFSFTGTSVTWIGTKGKDRGIAKVYVDGTLKGSIDQYAAATAYQQALYTVNGLANKAHKIKIVVTGTKRTTSLGKTVDVDAFVVR